MRRRWYALLAGILVLALLLIILHAAIPIYRTDSAGMAPCIGSGQRIFANRLAYSPLFHRQPQRGDVVVARTPEYNSPKHLGVKRIVALGGDTVMIQGGQVWLNGHILDEPYVQQPSSYTYPPSGGALTVPSGEMFLLGDTRTVSVDSHIYGPVPVTNIIGEVINGCHAV